MMLAWSFAARTADEVGALLRALGKHRYVREAEHAIHWTVDEALSFDPRFATNAALFARRAQEEGFDLSSRDPRLWRSAAVDDVIAVLDVFWTPGPIGARAKGRLIELFEGHEIAVPSHSPFGSDPDDPPHPELLLLDWELYSIDELDAERHRGALEAMERAREEVDVSSPVYQESCCLSLPELALGAPHGVLADDFVVWSDGAYSYADYVFRGAAKIARLVEPPLGIRDLE
jgi:hypothetical protein